MSGLEDDDDQELGVAFDLIRAFGSEAFSFFFVEPMASAAFSEIEYFVRREDIALPLAIEVGGGSAHVEGDHLACLHSFDYQVAHVLEHFLLLHLLIPDFNHL